MAAETCKLVGRVCASACLVALAGQSTRAQEPKQNPQTHPPLKAPQAAAPEPTGATSGLGASTDPLPPEDGQWTMVGKNYANWRFSGLDQISTDNAKNLKVAWTFDTGVNRGQEAAPLVVDGVMYVVTPYPNILYALQLHDPSTDPQKRSYSLKWKYEPDPQAAAQGVACCDVVCRGPCYSDGKIYYNTLDAHTVCVDAKTGKEVWKTKVGEINRGETTTMAVLVVKGKVLTGNSGGEFGVRGWLTALDAKDGKIAWRAYSTGPDSDCLIGNSFRPHYDSDKGKDLGVSTWPPGQWQIGGGTVWGFVSYDPELDLLYYGTANPGVWNAEQRPGENKWACGCFARRPETGEAVWYYQYSPHDLYDWDGVNEHVLVDLPMDGANKPKRKVLLHPDRNGHLYVLDRTTGEVLSAEPYSRNTATYGVDLSTGKLMHVPDKHPEVGKVIRDIQPFAPGAKDWQPASWSPKTGLFYMPHQNMAMDFEGMEANYIAGTPYVGAECKFYAGPGGNRGVLHAWDPVKGKPAWTIKENFPVWSGTCVTAGDVVFYGTMEGWFKAVHARTGEVLWQFKTGSGIIGQPVTFLGPDKKQYVAILSGVGGWAGAIVSGGLDPRDGSAALGFVNGMKDLPQATTKGGTLYVFSLP